MKLAEVSCCVSPCHICRSHMRPSDRQGTALKSTIFLKFLHWSIMMVQLNISYQVRHKKKKKDLDSKITLGKNTYFHIAWAPYIFPIVYAFSGYFSIAMYAFRGVFQNPCSRMGTKLKPEWQGHPPPPPGSRVFKTYKSTFGFLRFCISIPVIVS